MYKNYASQANYKKPAPDLTVGLSEDELAERRIIGEKRTEICSLIFQNKVEELKDFLNNNPEMTLYIQNDGKVQYGENPSKKLGQTGFFKELKKELIDFCVDRGIDFSEALKGAFISHKKEVFNYLLTKDFTLSEAQFVDVLGYIDYISKKNNYSPDFANSLLENRLSVGNFDYNGLFKYYLSNNDFDGAAKLFELHEEKINPNYLLEKHIASFNMDIKVHYFHELARNLDDVALVKPAQSKEDIIFEKSLKLFSQMDGFNPSIEDHTGSTPLEQMIFHKKYGMAYFYLLEFKDKLDVNHKNAKGKTPLHTLFYNKEDLVSIATPKIQALGEESKDRLNKMEVLLEELFDCGANPDIKSGKRNSGKTPKKLAEEFESNPAFFQLVEKLAIKQKIDMNAKKHFEEKTTKRVKI